MVFPRFYTLWAINAPLDENRLCRQLDAMRTFGFDGTVFHPRFYPGVPPYLGDDYMAVLSKVILYSKSIGMEFSIYDEDGWPSGTVGGQLLREYPQDRQQWADLVIDDSPDGDALGVFEHDGRRWRVVRRLGPGVDYLNPKLAQHFLAMTHERYRKGLDPAAFEHVSTFFSDEPEFGLGHAFDSLSLHGSIPWTPALPELYQQRYGERLNAALPKLFFPIAGHEETRVRFWELLTDLFCDAFIEPVNNWCKSHGKRLTAHVKGEEHPLFQVPTHGSAQQVFRRLSLPAIDALERDPSNDFFPRQLASAARQFGDGRSMVECFGGAGWGAQPDEFRRYLLWLGGHGITDFVVHLWQYRLSSHAIRDWPASIPNHIGWRDAFSQLLGQVKPEMTAAAECAGIDRADVLLVSPHRGVMSAFEPRELLAMNIHDAGTYADTSAGRINDRFMAIVADLQASGIAYHIADERTFESGTFTGDALQVGNCVYRRVILSDGCVLTSQGDELVGRSREAGLLHEVGSIAQTSGSWEYLRDRFTGGENWSILAPVNELPLEVVTTNVADWYRAAFDCETGVSELSLVFADEVSEISLNGHALVGRSVDEGTTAEIPAAAMIDGRNVVTFRSGFRPGDVQARPLVWIRGNFLVSMRGGLVDGPNETKAIEGPFVLIKPAANVGRDLTSAGYPFVRGPITATTTVNLPAEASDIQLVGIAADAARAEIDDKDCGFTWGPDWRVPLPGGIKAGQHVLTLTLYPSAYNTFGPHHHIDGDHHIISPVQFQGKKNFADHPDAPDKTHVSAWHIKPVAFPSAIKC